MKRFGYENNSYSSSSDQESLINNEITSFHEKIDINYHHSTSELQANLKLMKERYSRLQTEIFKQLVQENVDISDSKNKNFVMDKKVQEDRNASPVRHKVIGVPQQFYKKFHELPPPKLKYKNGSKNKLLMDNFNNDVHDSSSTVLEVDQLTKENSLLKATLQDFLQHSIKYPELYDIMKDRVLEVANVLPLEKGQIVNSGCENDVDENEESKDLKKVILEEISVDSLAMDERSFESVTLETFTKAQENMQKICALLKERNQQLSSALPEIILARQNQARNIRDSCSKAPSWHSGAEGGFPDSCSGAGEELNVLVEEIEEACRAPADPDYNWTKIELSENLPEGRISSQTRQRPETRTVSTSPPSSMLSLDSPRTLCPSERHRTCPMCHAVFPNSLSIDDFESHVVGHFEQDSDWETLT